MTREERRIVCFLAISVVLGSLVLLLVKRARPRPVPLEWRDRVEEPTDSPLEPLNVNVATFEELMRVPGIGPVLARRIVERREQRGGFTSLESLRDVKGIGEKRLREIEPYLRFDGGDGGEADASPEVEDAP